MITVKSVAFFFLELAVSGTFKIKLLGPTFLWRSGVNCGVLKGCFIHCIGL